MRVRIKICGVTRPGDARFAASLGVDAIGLNFYPPSPRFLATTEAARAVRASVPAFVASVAVFVNPEEEEVWRVIREIGVDMLQFHGTEPASFCEQFALPYLKAVGMREEGVDLAAAAAEHPEASALLLDVHDTQRWGGTGRSFDWSAARADEEEGGGTQDAPALPPIVLAGGLTPDNVAEAVRTARPFAVDVCGGVESAAGGGAKDAARLAAFVEEVERVGVDAHSPA